VTAVTHTTNMAFYLLSKLYEAQDRGRRTPETRAIQRGKEEAERQQSALSEKHNKQYTQSGTPTDRGRISNSDFTAHRIKRDKHKKDSIIYYADNSIDY
jgi:hypothetical protein